MYLGNQLLKPIIIRLHIHYFYVVIRHLFLQVFEVRLVIEIIYGCRILILQSFKLAADVNSVFGPCRHRSYPWNNILAAPRPL